MHRDRRFSHGFRISTPSHQFFTHAQSSLYTFAASRVIIEFGLRGVKAWDWGGITCVFSFYRKTDSID
jgi:hypothetical protein